MPAIATEARQALADIATEACDQAGTTDDILACFDAAEDAVANALRAPVVI